MGAHGGLTDQNAGDGGGDTESRAGTAAVEVGVFRAALIPTTISSKPRESCFHSSTRRSLRALPPRLPFHSQDTSGLYAITEYSCAVLGILVPSSQ